MKASDLKKRLAKDRPMTSVTLRMPEDVVVDLKRIAPLLGFSGYQPLVRHYVGQGLRADLARLDDTPALGRLLESLKRRGVDEALIADAVAETMPEAEGARNIGQEILESVRAIKRGEGTRRRVAARHPEALGG